MAKNDSSPLGMSGRQERMFSHLVMDLFSQYDNSGGIVVTRFSRMVLVPPALFIASPELARQKRQNNSSVIFFGMN